MKQLTRSRVLRPGPTITYCRITGQRRFDVSEVLRRLARTARPALRCDLCPWCGDWHLRPVEAGPLEVVR